MPQLDPVPWFCYLLITWLIFMLLAPNKIMAYVSLNKLNTKKAKMISPQTWTWTWQ
uniref:ATP synthase complex subunit 8 n=1 Tax=Odorrana ishikawae TaxID=310659 RepID=D7UPS4_ODOIS|nr:ATP synthase F0 subunit 8 [Odorrana ishikawae]BAJ10917.1 ATPase subunit 8 [Odorrana ishikawae]